MAKRIVDVPLLLRERLGEDFNPEKIVGYRYSIGYIIEDWDFPIENYYCEKEEYWVDDKYRNLGDRNALEELIAQFSPMRRGYYDQFYKADNGQWPSLRWASIDVFIVDGNNEETIRIETKDRVEVVYGAFEGLRLWLETLLKS